MTSFKRVFATSPLTTEAFSFHEAIVLGRKIHLQSVIFESDNKILVECCMGNSKKEKIRGIIEDILLLKY